MMKQKFYNVEEIIKQNCTYNVLYGERSNGKSYSVKEHCIKDCYKRGKMFGYVRRWKEEIKNDDVTCYFADSPITEWTNGEYNCIDTYRGNIYLANINAETGQKTRGQQIGRAFALTQVSHYKSLAFPDIEYVIFEEFITEMGYLPHEVDNLMSLISTIARRRKITVFLIGNTIDRRCPYFSEWGLTHIPKQKQGTIDIYERETTQIDENCEKLVIRIAVEYCANSGKNSSMFFGKNEKSITAGAWECEAQPHLEKPFEQYKKITKILVVDKMTKYMINLLKDENGFPFLHIYPYTKREPPQDCKRIITNEYSTNPYITPRLTVVSRYDEIIIDLIRKRKCTFSDNLTGTEFYNIVKEIL